MNSPAMRPVMFSLVEEHCNLRHMRNVKSDLQAALLLLQEQQRVGHNGHRNAAQLVLDAELFVVEEICRKLWESIAPAAPIHPPPP